VRANARTLLSLRSRLAPISDRARRQNGENASHLRAMVPECRRHNLAALLRCQAAKADQYYACRDLALTKHVLSEITIARDEMALCRFASARIASSFTLGEISAIYVTSWPVRRSSSTTC
jgi:hypothetical protein